MNGRVIVAELSVVNVKVEEHLLGGSTSSLGSCFV
jgi:hypothetical protein